jgi:hypothetical protein
MSNGYFLMTPELLREVLHLPQDCEITSVEMDPLQLIKVSIEHPDVYGQVNPTFGCEDGCEPVFLSWNPVGTWY